MAKPRDPNWFPFSDRQPVDFTELKTYMGGEEVARLDGPAVPGTPSSSGGTREVEPMTEEASDFEQIEDLVAEEFLWRMIEQFEAFHNRRHPSPRPGPARGYTFMDIQVVEAATPLHQNFKHTLRNMRDPKNWVRLVDAAEAAFPNDTSRRLSPKAPSRSQIYRAKRDYFTSEALTELKRWYRAEAVTAAKDMGIFDPKAGDWDHPHKLQSIVGDMTWMAAATRHHYKALHDPDSKAQRIDLDADFHHTRDGNLTKVPGRELVMLSCRTGHGNERVPLDAEFMPRKDHHSRKNRNEADFALDMLERLIAENRTALRGQPGQAGGLKCFMHDMAMDSEAIDKTLGMRIMPFVKVPLLAGGKHRDGSLGPHNFTTRTGDTEELDVHTFNGTPWVRFPASRKRKPAVPLHRVHFYWGTEDGQSILYGTVALPDHAYVPKALRGATTQLRFNSTQDEIHSKPKHRRRTRSLRPFPEGDPDFKLFGLREDIESLFSDLKYRTRGKLPSIYQNRNDFNIVSYMVLRLSRSRAAHRKRSTAPDAVPIAA